MRVGGEERRGLQCGEGGEYDMIEGWKGKVLITEDQQDYVLEMISLLRDRKSVV